MKDFNRNLNIELMKSSVQPLSDFADGFGTEAAVFAARASVRTPLQGLTRLSVALAAIRSFAIKGLAGTPLQGLTLPVGALLFYRNKSYNAKA